MRLRTALCPLVLTLASMSSPGAEIFYLDHDPYTDRYVGPVGPLVISGEIVPGDYDRLLSKILDDEIRFLAQNKIILASDGGDVGEALKIASLVKALYSAVTVAPLTGRCVSACFFIYAAAGQREADGERLIGINRPFIADSDAAPIPSADAGVESKALTQVRVFLKENAVPGYLVEEMFRRASDDAYWLSAEDQKNLGYRSPAFNRFASAKCAWDDAVERDVYGGKRPVDVLKPMLICRTRATQDAAHQALILAARDRAARGSEPSMQRVGAPAH